MGLGVRAGLEHPRGWATTAIESSKELAGGGARDELKGQRELSLGGRTRGLLGGHRALTRWNSNPFAGLTWASPACPVHRVWRRLRRRHHPGGSGGAEVRGFLHQVRATGWHRGAKQREVSQYGELIPEKHCSRQGAYLSGGLSAKGRKLGKRHCRGEVRRLQLPHTETGHFTFRKLFEVGVDILLLH